MTERGLTQSTRHITSLVDHISSQGVSEELRTLIGKIVEILPDDELVWFWQDLAVNAKDSGVALQALKDLHPILGKAVIHAINRLYAIHDDASNILNQGYCNRNLLRKEQNV